MAILKYVYDCGCEAKIFYSSLKHNVTVFTHCNCKKCMKVELLSYGHGCHIPQQVK